MRRCLALLIPVMVLAAGACGDDDAAPGADTGAPRASEAALVVTAEDIGFASDAHEATAGSVDIEYRNEGVILHTLVIEGPDGRLVPGFELSVSGRGDVSQGSVELDAGEYVLFCDVAGHRGAGMEAALTVR